MYWSRTGSLTDLLFWLLLTALWWSGGTLISIFAFQLPKREQIFTGLAIGLFFFILSSNLWGLALPISWAFWAGGFSVLIAGGLAAAIARPDLSHLRFSRHRLQQLFFANWQTGLGFALLFVLFSLFNRGLALFDDYSNLPLVSSLAASGLPPYFFMDSQIVLDYHYGLHLFAASLVRIGGFFPWSAFDLARTLTITLTLLLAYFWFRRLTAQPGLIAASVLLICFGAGARWLWLFAPPSIINAASENIQMWGSALQSAPNFASALSQPWKIGGSGPFPFSFAFANGIFRPLTLALGGNGAVPQLTILLLLLTGSRLSRPGAAVTDRPSRRVHIFASLTVGLLLASLALTADHLLMMLWAGAAAVAMLLLLSRLNRLAFLIRRPRQANSQTVWQANALVLNLLTAACLWLPGLLLAPTMGGVVTGMVQHVTTPETGAQVFEEATTIGFTGAGLRWPPAIVSAHLGELSLTNPYTLLAALTEMGPVLLLGPWLLGLTSWLLWKRNHLRPLDLLIAVLSWGALSGLAGPMIFTLNTADRDMSRLTGEALYIWMALGCSLLLIKGVYSSRSAQQLPLKARWLQHLVSIGFLIVIWGGIALLPTQWIAIARPQLTFFVEEIDALYARQYWDRLEPEAMVMGFGYPSRNITLFGRNMGHAYKTYGVPYPEFAALLSNPDPIGLAQAGYLYLYAEKREWQDLTPQQRQAFNHPCVRRLPKPASGVGETRLFFDLRKCVNLGSAGQKPYQTAHNSSEGSAPK